MPDSRELTQLIVEAEDIAQAVDQRLTTAHLLLAVFTLPCPARALLQERGADEKALLAALPGVPKEPASVVDDLLARTREIAQGLGTNADSLHLLMAMAASPECLAHGLLAHLKLPLASLRNTILSWYTGGRIPRQYLKQEGRNVPAENGRRAARVALRSGAKRSASIAAGSFASPARLGGGATTARDAARSAPETAKSAAALPLEAREVVHPAKEEVGESGAQARGAPVAFDDFDGPSDFGAFGEGASGDLGADDFGSGDLHFPPSSGAGELPPPFALESSLFPTLTAFGRNLSKAAAEGELDPLIGRDEEVDRVVDILGKRRGNNPILVGEAGVGKTALVEGVAQRLLALGSDRVIVELDMASLVSGTALRGAFSERLEAIKEEVRHAGGRVIVFIDEIHTLIGAGVAGDGPQDAANELKAALARGEFPCIGATTFDEYRKHIESDPALERRFTVVHVEEPTVEEAVRILAGLAPRYEAHHQVRIEDGALRAAAELTARFLHDRQLPDKAIQAIDLASSRTRRRALEAVGIEAVAEVVAEMAGLPAERLLQSDSDRLLRIEEALALRVVGHQDALSRIAATLRRNFAGFSSRRPLGSFLLLGPTGVGKTELAKALAEVLFGSERALVRIDMSELSEANGVSRLLGAPPGYVGYGEGGQLTEAVRRRPASVVLLDEVEKSHRDVWMLLLQILEEGEITDGKGRRVDFSQTVVILTSNLGAEAFAARGGRMGFASAESAEAEQRDRALEEARRSIPPELWNRLDERCLLAPLGEREVGMIAERLLSASAARLRAERGIHLHFAPEVVEHLLRSGGYDPELGARPMRQAIQRQVEGPLAEAILRGEFPPGSEVRAILHDGAVAFT